MNENKFYENYPLVINTAKKYSSNTNHIEDLIQEGSIGLCKAIENYSFKPGCKFSTYALYWIKGEILKYLNKDTINPSKKEKNTPSYINYCEITDDIESLNSYNESSSAEQTLINTEVKEKVLNLMKHLTLKEQKILMLRYGINSNKMYSIKEISNLLEVSPYKLKTMQVQAENKLKKLLYNKQLYDFL